MTQIEQQKTLFQRLFQIENIFLVYIALKPIYIFRSGLPQISDMFFLVCFSLLCFKLQKESNLSLKEKRIIVLFVVTIFYQAFIQFVYFFLTSKSEFIFKVLFYLFNAISSIFFFLVFHKAPREKMRDIVLNGCFLSCIVIIAGLIFNRGSSLRQTSFFNNPNQLGYYCLLVLTATLYLSPSNFSKIKLLIIHSSIIYASVLSYSKGAVIGIILAYFSYFSFRLNLKRPLYFIIYVAFIIASSYAVYDFINNDDGIATRNEAVNNLRRRIVNLRDENDSDLYNGRGYGRVYEVMPHILWGVAEGDYDRFRIMSGLEIHSTFISLLVSYGVIGLTLYIVLVMKLICADRFSVTFKNCCILSGVLFYALSHNGVRNTFLWIILSLICLCSEDSDLPSKSPDETSDVKTSS